MNLYKQIKNKNSSLSVWVAKHPKNGLYYGIDNVLRCPVTDGFKTKQEAREAYIEYISTATACHISALKDIGNITGKNQLD